MVKLQSLLVAAFLAASTAAAEIPRSWTTPIEPFRVAGNIYYVGTVELASWLLVTDAGYILLDAPLHENVPQVLANIETLGLDPGMIRVLLNSHAHGDHAGGLAAIKAKTGAKLYLSEADAALAARGGRGDFAFGDAVPYPPVVADEIVKDGTVVTLGSATMTARLTPGHTKGNTTWITRVTEGDRELGVVFAPSMSTPGYQLAGNRAYPEIVSDYRRSFEILGTLSADIMLSTHGSFFDLEVKAAARRNGGPNIFVDPDELGEFVAYWRARFEDELAAQTAR